MTFLAKTIARSKWNGSDLPQGEIPADAVTADLRTRSNKLSFWRCGEAEDAEVEKVALARAASRERVDKLEIVWIEESYLVESRIALEETRGETPLEEMAKKHIDAAQLDLARLGAIAERVDYGLQAGQYARFTVSQVKKLLVQALQDGVLRREVLQQKVLEAVEKELARLG